MLHSPFPTKALFVLPLLLICGPSKGEIVQLYRLIGFEMSPRNDGYAFDGRQCGINDSQQCYYFSNTYARVPVDLPSNELDLTCRKIYGDKSNSVCNAGVHLTENGKSFLSIFDHANDYNVTLREMVKQPPTRTSYVALLNKSDHPESAQCGRYQHAAQGNFVPQNAPVYDQWLQSAMTCSPVKPTPTWCALSEASTNLTFNDVMMSEWKGTRASTRTKIYCSGKTSYKLSLVKNSPTGSVALSNGGIARITVNGSALGSSLTGLAGEQQVEVVAQLDGTPSAAGPFTGNDVLRVSYN